MSSNKAELMAKLEKISELYENTLAIQNKMDNYVPDDNYERKIVVPEFPENKSWKSFINHSNENAVRLMAAQHESHYAPKKPDELKIKDFEYEEDPAYTARQTKLRGLSYAAGGISIFFLLSIIIGSAEGAVIPILIIMLLSAAAFAFLRYKINESKTVEEKKKAEAFAAYNAHKNKLWNEHKEQINKYENEYASYKLRKQEFLDKYTAWREIYIKSEAEETKIKEKLEDDKITAINKISEKEYSPALQELSSTNDLIANEYLPAINIIADLLKSNRADDLKEAINLYEDMLYRERQLQLQREQEEHRRREEEKKRQDEERRHREEMAFRQKQEDQRRRDEEKKRQNEERRYREEKAFQEQQERNRQYEENRRRQEERNREAKAELERKRAQDRATTRQCNTCALVGHCSVAFTRHNCASYKPR